MRPVSGAVGIARGLHRPTRSAYPKGCSACLNSDQEQVVDRIRVYHIRKWGHTLAGTRSRFILLWVHCSGPFLFRVAPRAVGSALVGPSGVSGFSHIWAQSDVSIRETHIIGYYNQETTRKGVVQVGTARETVLLETNSASTATTISITTPARSSTVRTTMSSPLLVAAVSSRRVRAHSTARGVRAVARRRVRHSRRRRRRRRVRRGDVRRGFITRLAPLGARGRGVPPRDVLEGALVCGVVFTTARLTRREPADNPGRVEGVVEGERGDARAPRRPSRRDHRRGVAEYSRREGAAIQSRDAHLE